MEFLRYKNLFKRTGNLTDVVGIDLNWGETHHKENRIFQPALAPLKPEYVAELSYDVMQVVDEIIQEGPLAVLEQVKCKERGWRLQVKHDVANVLYLNNQETICKHPYVILAVLGVRLRYLIPGMNTIVPLHITSATASGIFNVGIPAYDTRPEGFFASLFDRTPVGMLQYNDTDPFPGPYTIWPYIGPKSRLIPQPQPTLANALGEMLLFDVVESYGQIMMKEPPTWR